MSAGKLAAQIGHCAEAYWIDMIRNNCLYNNDYKAVIQMTIDINIYNNYINSGITKTICAAKNLYQLLKAKDIAKKLGLIGGS